MEPPKVVKKEEEKTSDEGKGEEELKEKLNEKAADEAKDDGIDIEQQTDAIETMARSLQTSRQGSQKVREN